MNRIINPGFDIYNPNTATYFHQTPSMNSRWHLDSNGNLGLGRSGALQQDFTYAKHPRGYEVWLYSEHAIQTVYNFRNTRYTTFFATEEDLTLMLLSLKGTEIK